ncbi:hypothetical protein [Streptomyces virginiae]|uniref:hypothetical protein n=1 Tax=Streptomyces virginiae TaxID=1961 RepID=UPI00331A6022
MRTRRLIPPLRFVGLFFLLTCQSLMLSTPASAHGDTVKVVVTGQEDGYVTTDLTWENDEDPVDEAVAATVNAVSPDGSRTAGPWKLMRAPGKKAGWTSAERLPPGIWKVSVDVGFPSLGHGDLEVSIPAVDPAPATSPPIASPPVSLTLDPPAEHPSSSSAAVFGAGDSVERDDGFKSDLPPWIIILVAGIACVALVHARKARKSN